MKNRSLFWPLLLIATGVVWLLINMNVIPPSNLWALTHIWPYVLIALGVGLLLGTIWAEARKVVSLLVIIGAVAAVFYAPQLGWAGGPDWNFDADFGGSVKGSGKIVTETRDVQDFLAISIEYPAEIVVQQGKSESVKVEADDNLLPQLTTEMRNGTLFIENNERDWSKRVNPSRPVRIMITVKDLREVDFSSAGTLLVEDLKTDEFKMVLSGAGEVTFSKINVRKLESILSGAGNIKANGVADNVKLIISGFGSFEAPDLASMVADVRITGAGNAVMRVKNELTAAVSGAGSVKYYGSPHVTKNISGAGSVNQAGD
ncbi:MAG: DUF2807 domain-containing protein [Chloroflexi bacterium]|nr:DUF2807 domain-containing protein [Chloroflexota bacterium]